MLGSVSVSTELNTRQFSVGIFAYLCGQVNESMLKGENSSSDLQSASLEPYAKGREIL